MNYYGLLEQMLENANLSKDLTVQNMKDTVEDSPWHREANVWVHTEMVVGEYLKMWKAQGDEDNHLYFLGGVAALFHDFGKPEAEEEVSKDDGTVYRRYKGHESFSAGKFREYVLDDHLWADLFGLKNPFNGSEANTWIYLVSLFIEHHLPYQYGKDLKQGLVDTLVAFKAFHPFVMMMTADCHGRISDDHDDKKEQTSKWIQSAKDAIGNRPKSPYADRNKFSYVLIGAPGSGKSSNSMIEGLGDGMIFNMDTIRLEYFSEETDNPILRYDIAFKNAMQDPSTFDQLVTKHINELVKSGHKCIVSDNTNITRKARRQYLAAARQKGYENFAIVWFVSLRTLLERNAKRTDHKVPRNVIRSMFYRMQMPLLNEVELVTFWRADQ